MPEKAGGRAAQTTSILRLRGSICTIRPTASMASGIMTSFRNEPMKTWLLNVILTEDSVIPAANTATEAFAPAMRVKDGSSQVGHLRPQSTRITASMGAHATGCSRACSTGFHALGFLPPFSAAALAASPALRRLSPIGMPRALTSMATIAITRPTAAEVPKIGCSTANPRKPIVGEPLIRAEMAASEVVSL